MKKSMFFAVLFSVLLASSASAFTLSADDASSKICIGSTNVLQTVVEGKGSFTVVQEGSAAPFSMTVPSQFDSEELQTVYSYITPSSKVKEGSYELKIRVNDGSEEKEQMYDINVKDCPQSEFKAESKKTTCPCQKTKIRLTLANNAAYTESFKLSAEGTLKEWINLSEESISLGPNEEKEIEALIDAPCNIHGQYDIIFKAKPSRYFSSIVAKSVLDIQPCYEFALSFPKQEYSLCENDALKVPLEVLNEGTADNSFKLVVSGAKWVSYNKSLALSAGEEETLEIMLNPPYGTYGNFTIKVDSFSEYGSVNKKAEITALVEKCYGLSAYFSSKKEIICDPSEEYEYTFSVKNSGKFEQDMNLSIEGPEWAVLEESLVSVKNDKSEEVKVKVKLPSNADAGDYKIKVKASDGLAESSDELTVKYAALGECYAPKISLNQSSVSLALEEQKIIEASIENKGLDEATFILDIEGNATSFSILNPSIVKLKPGKSQKVFIHVSPQIFAEIKDYDLKLTARAKDTKIKSSEDISIKVLESPEVQEGNEVVKEGLFSKIYSGIGGFFSKVKESFKSAFGIGKNETAVREEAPEENETVEVKETAEEDAAVEADTPKVISVADLLNNSGNETSVFATEEDEPGIEIVENKTKGSFSLLSLLGLKKEVVNATADEGNATEAEEVEESDVEPEDAETGEEPTELAEEDVNGTDLNVTELNWDNAKSSFMNFGAYKSYILGAFSLIIIIIIFATGWWKKIIDFFDEDED